MKRKKSRGDGGPPTPAEVAAKHHPYLEVLTRRASGRHRRLWFRREWQWVDPEFRDVRRFFEPLCKFDTGYSLFFKITHNGTHVEFWGMVKPQQLDLSVPDFFTKFDGILDRYAAWADSLFPFTRWKP